MKISALGATLMAATFVVATPAFAKHTGHKAHHATKTAMHQKADKGDAATDDLNARSLQQAQTPVPVTAPAAAPMASATAPAPAPAPMPMDNSMKMPASTMPAPAGQ